MARRTFQRTPRSIPPRFQRTTRSGAPQGNGRNSPAPRASSQSGSSSQQYPSPHLASQGYSQQEYSPQGYSSREHPSQGHSQQGYSSQGHSQQGYSRTNSRTNTRGNSRSEPRSQPRLAQRTAPSASPRTASPTPRTKPQAFVPPPDVHTLFALPDNERLYLTSSANNVTNNVANNVVDSSANTGFTDTALTNNVPTQNRYEQALMRHLGLLETAYSGFEMRGAESYGEDTEEVGSTVGEEDNNNESLNATDTSNQELRADGTLVGTSPKFARNDLSAHRDAHRDVRRDAPTKQDRLEAKRLESSKADAEEDETRSPFGDVISSVHEILKARNAGRYMPAPRDKSEQYAARQAQQKHLVLHPATTLRYYMPPNKNTSNNQRGRQPYRPTTQHPAAVPQEDVFGVMPSEIKSYYERVQTYLSHDALLARGATFIAAVSGGVDSLAMLDMLVWLQKAHRYKIIVVHFNHHLRGGESDQDEYFVRETAKRYGLSCYIASADVGLVSRTERLSIEHAARQVRYNALEFIARKVGADAVCTAHTLNDSVETMLLNLMRGSGLAGLSGIPSERSLGISGKIIRPLLARETATETSRRWV